jgi:hypothetical protein
MKRICPRAIDKKTIEYYQENYKTLNYGGERAIEFFPILRKIAHYDLRNLFTENELKFFVDIYSDHVLNSLDTHRESLLAYINYSVDIDRADEKWEINKEGLIEIVEKFNDFQAFFLVEWAVTFWRGQKKEGLEEYVEKMHWTKWCKEEKTK